LLQDHAARAYLDGRLTEAEWNRFAVAGHRFIAAHTLAADLMKTWQQAGRPVGERARVQAALAELPPLLDDLRALLQSFHAAAHPRGLGENHAAD
jgi:hypothetical protein